MEPEIIPWPLLFFENATHKYTPEFVKKCGGKITDVWLFDVRSTTNCCEITPSYEMWYFGSVAYELPEEDEAREELETQLEAANIASGQEPAQYFQYSGDLRRLTDEIEKLPKEEVPTRWDYKTTPFVMQVEEPDEAMWQDYLNEEDGDRRQAHRRLIDGVLEEINANHPY